MHPLTFDIAIVWLAALLAFHTIQAVRARDLIVRVLAIDTATLMLVAVLLVFTLHTRTPHYLDAALVLALLAFAETLVAAKFLIGGGLFK